MTNLRGSFHDGNSSTAAIVVQGFERILFILPQSLEIDEMINRIARHKGVIGVMVFNNDGIAIKSNFDESQTNLWATLVADVTANGQLVGKSISERHHMTMVRIRSSKYEVKITSEDDHILVSIHQQVNEN